MYRQEREEREERKEREERGGMKPDREKKSIQAVSLFAGGVMEKSLSPAQKGVVFLLKSLQHNRANLVSERGLEVLGVHWFIILFCMSECRQPSLRHQVSLATDYDLVPLLNQASK